VHVALVVLEGAPEGAGLEPVDPLERLGPSDRAVGDGPLPRPHRPCLERHAEALLAATQFLLGATAIGDVHRDPDHPHDAPTRVTDRGVRVHDVEAAAVLARCAPLPAPRFARPDPLEDPLGRVGVAGLHEELRHGTADRLVPRVAVERLRTSVPVRDRAVGVGGDHRGADRVEQRRLVDARDARGTVDELEPDARRWVVVDAPAIGDPVDEVQPPAALGVERAARTVVAEPRTRIGHLDADPSVARASGQLDLFVGGGAGVTHRVRHDLAHEEPEVVEERRRHAVIADVELVERAARERRGFGRRGELPTHRPEADARRNRQVGHATSPRAVAGV
jgi:hypothetical protein